MECKQEESKTGPRATHFCFLHPPVVWLPLPVSAKAAPGAGPCPFSSPARVDALSLHLSSLAPALEAGTPAAGQEPKPGEAALEILVVLITLAQFFQALSLLLERRNGLIPHTALQHMFFVCYFLATAAAPLRKGSPVLPFTCSVC